METAQAPIKQEGITMINKNFIDYYWNGEALASLVGARRAGPDSLYVPNFMQQLLEPSDLCAKLMDLRQYPWVDREESFMAYRGNPLNREKWLGIDGHYDHRLQKIQKFPRYGYTGAQWQGLLSYVDFSKIPLVNECVIKKFKQCFTFGSNTQDRAPFNINHAIGTLYKDGNDYIGFHEDKPEDIRPNTPIVLVSLGEEREFHLKDNATSSIEVFVVQEGDLFILGPETNMVMKHSIVKLADEQVLKRDKVGQRMSIVLRDIKTVLSRKTVLAKIENSCKQKLQKDVKKRKELEREESTQGTKKISKE